MNYNAPWFSRPYWIFEHLEDLSLEAHELILLLVVSYLVDQNIGITYETLREKCHLPEDLIDDAINSLSAKGYLRIDLSSGQLSFIIDTLFDEFQERGKPVEMNVLEAFEQEFRRTLSGPEIERINALATQFGQDELIYALDEAAVYDKRYLAYIESILTRWKAKGLTLEDLEQGRR